MYGANVMRNTVCIFAISVSSLKFVLLQMARLNSIIIVGTGMCVASTVEETNVNRGRDKLCILELRHMQYNHFKY